MSSVVISGDTSGAITLAAPSVAGTNTITLPASTGTAALLQTPSFATTIGVGGATPASSGAGISFPATQSTSTDANTLDDYEEGTWTPVTATLTTTGTVTTNGKYTKVGNLVTVYGNVNATTITCSNASRILSGFPFSSVSVYSCGILVNGAVTQTVGLQMDGNLGVYSTAIVSTSSIYFTITYYTS